MSKIANLKKEIEKLKKYSIFKLHRLKIDNILKEEEQVKDELFQKQIEYEKLLDLNSPIKDDFAKKAIELNLLKNNKLKKAISIFKYSELQKQYQELNNQLTEKLSIEEKAKLEIDLLDNRISEYYNQISQICGFEFDKEYYYNFLEEFRERGYYSIDLFELIEKKEQELKKYEEGK